MIALESSDERHFIGRLDPGDNPFAGILEFCAENMIKTGWLQAVAVINGIEIKTASPGHGFAGEAKFFDGQWFCPMVSGNLSTLAGRPDLRIYVSCHSSDGRVISGLLAGGVVEMFEFNIRAIDDMALQRDPADNTYAAWTNLVPIRKKRPLPSSGVNKPDSVEPIGKKIMQRPESSIDLLLDMEPGNFLQHPTLGKCRIMSKPNEGKIRIRLGNGRIANLDARVLDIRPYKVINGNRVYPVKVRKI